MHQLSNFRARTWGGGLFAILILCFGLLASLSVSAAHTSVVCAAQSGTVATGGTVSFNITNCATGIGFAGTGVVDGPALPAHGSATLRITDNKWFVDYRHNGDNASSDVFEFTDGTVAGNTVRLTITISKAKAGR